MTEEFSKLQLGNDKYLAYHRYEDGSNAKPGVVYLPGFAGDMEGHKVLAVEQYCIQNGHNFVRFDYLGHGKSSGKFEDYVLSNWVDNTIKIIDELTVGPQIIVGSSMGGWVMLHLALQRAKRVAALIGIAPAPDFTEMLMWNQLSDAQKKEITEQGYIALNHESGEPYYVTHNMIKDGKNMLLLGSPININCPVTIIHGMKDMDVPYQVSLELTQKLLSEDIEIHFIKNAEHRFSESHNIEFMLDCLHRMVKKINQDKQN